MFHAVSVHVVDLERLATDGGRGNIVVVATENDDASTDAPILLVAAFARHEDVFVNLGAKTDKEEQDGGEE